MKGCCLLACSPWLVLPSFSQYPGPSIYSWVTHPQWAVPTYINSKLINCPTDSPTDQSIRSILSIVVPFCNITVAYIKLKKSLYNFDLFQFTVSHLHLNFINSQAQPALYISCSLTGFYIVFLVQIVLFFFQDFLSQQRHSS